MRGRGKKGLGCTFSGEKILKKKRNYQSFSSREDERTRGRDKYIEEEDTRTRKDPSEGARLKNNL